MLKSSFSDIDIDSLTMGDLIRLQIYMGRLNQAESLLRQINSDAGSPEDDYPMAADSACLLNAIEFNRKKYAPIAADVNNADMGKINVVGTWSVKWTPSGGMFIKGQTEAACERVLIYANDKLIKIIKTQADDSLMGKRSFIIFFCFDLLRAFPEKTILALGADSGMLLHQAGSYHYWDDRITGCDGLFEKLEKGYFITHKGKLRLPAHKNTEWKLGIVSAYTDFAAYFQSAFGQAPFIVNTTLLGCLLKGDFLDEDDGFYIAYFSAMSSPEHVKEEMSNRILRILKDGIDITLPRGRGYFKPRINDKKLTVYPLWRNQDKLCMLNRVFAGNTATINPLRTQSFQGVDVYLPNQPDAFLERKYGDNWREFSFDTIPVTDDIEQADFDYLENARLSSEDIKKLYAHSLSGKGRLSVENPDDKVLLDAERFVTAG